MPRPALPLRAMFVRVMPGVRTLVLVSACVLGGPAGATDEPRLGSPAENVQLAPPVPLVFHVLQLQPATEPAQGAEPKDAAGAKDTAHGNKAAKHNGKAKSKHGAPCAARNGKHKTS